MEMTTRVRVAVFGVGRLGRRHAEVIAYQVPNADLVAIVDANPAAAESVATALGIERWSSDSDEVMADPEIDAVVIASSTATHAPLIIAAAKAGKDIFCEKPIALDLDATDEAADAVAAAGVRLQVGFQRRFDPSYVKAKQMIDEGIIGRIEFIRDAMRDPVPASREYLATCGGMFRDLTIHNFDNVRWLMGEPVEEVFTMGSALVDPMFVELNDVDTSVVSVRFANGSLASIESGRRSGFGYDVRTEVFGSEGALMIGYTRETAVLHYSKAGVQSDHVQWFLDRFGDAYTAELVAFVDSIVNDLPVPVTCEDGRAALAMAYAAERSLQEHRPVRLQEFDRGTPS
jgi:myo-inositol 2-dehydrogenase/D-chiro-inositol 1-dehydrogenase